MAPGFIAFVVILVVAQLALPRRFAFLPLIVAGAHLGNVEILPQLTTARLLILIGLTRAVSSGTFSFSLRSCRLDAWMIVFAAAALVSTIGHEGDQYIPSPFMARAGLVLNVVGTYLYARAFIADINDFKRYSILLLFVLLPLAFFLTVENRTMRNFYYLLGARSDTSMTRDGKVRAQGPFQHPILAGTAGATALPFAYLAWRRRQKLNALVGAAGCLGVVLACASSGPLAAVAVTFASIILWRWRNTIPLLLWTALAIGILYWITRGRGPWYIMASLDLVGGSTGWHRAYLIDQGFKHLNEWWLWGTDYTRHWMASGVRWNPNMVDLTNYYLHLGVTGGLPLSLSLIALIVCGFRTLAASMRNLRTIDPPSEMVLWAAGASLAAHAMSFVSISYFDQMYIFFYLLLGAIPGLAMAGRTQLNDPSIVGRPVADRSFA